MTLGRRRFARAALVSAFALTGIAYATSSYDWATKYNVDISRSALGDALFALSRQTGTVSLYPYELTQVRSNPVKGQYTVSEALALMLQGTGFSGEVTSQGVVSISLRVRGCSKKERAMLQNLKSSVSMLALFAGLVAAPACAQNQPSSDSGDGQSVETITVTGYRASLQSAAFAKRDATNFTDSVFAEDIGKFPDLNIAEAINRVPGIQLNRDSSGEGVQIVVRGLGPSFTNMLMNGHPISVATDGSLGDGNQNREVDLDLFPVELFTRITVSKSPSASTYEGGIAGTVNMSTAKPLDSHDEGLKINYGLQEEYNNSANSFSPRGSVIASYNWNDKLGILFGVAGQHYKFRVDGYETVGNALADVVDQHTDCKSCNTIGTGKNFRWATVVPPGVAADASLGIGATGTAYNYAGTETAAGGTSGLSLSALSNSIWPYLAREEYKAGSKNRLSFLTDVQYRASENLEFNLGVMYEYSQRLWTSTDLDLYVRNSCNSAGTAASCMVPVNVQDDDLGYVTSATLYNSGYFLSYFNYRENVGFLDVNPSVDWSPTPWLKIHGSIDYNDSSMNRRNWSYMIQTTPGAGYTTNYTVTPGADMPTITTNAPISDPTSSTWQWYQVRAQPLYRDTVNRGTDWSATLGDDTTNLVFGYSYNQNHRYIYARDNGTMAQYCITGSGACTMPDGTTRASGNALIPNSSLSQYLTNMNVGDFLHLGDGSNGYDSFIGINLKKIDKASHLRDLMENAPFTATGAFGAQKSGIITEKTQNGYTEANTVVRFLDRDMHFNAGVRYYNTQQVITGPVSSGGSYVWVTTSHTYQGALPSFNFSTEVYDNIVFRAGGSRTMTRPQPSAMLPGYSFGSALVSPISAGNANLKPYFSTNMDLGLEWYTGGPGVLSVNYFRKDISNFTATSTYTTTFGKTGIPQSILTPTQLADYNANGGDDESVEVTSTTNISQDVHLEGFELNWVQPLDFLLKGAGVSATYTRLTQSVDAGLSESLSRGLVTGIAPYTFNIGGYYENDGLSLHVVYNFRDKMMTTASPASQGIEQPIYSEGYGQLDFSASYELKMLEGTPFEGSLLTFDCQNLTGSRMRSYSGSENSAYSVAYPGTSIILGFRGKI